MSWFLYDVKDRVCGLCGNFDGNVNNDMMSSNNKLEVDASHFGNSWKVIPSCADVTEVVVLNSHAHYILLPTFCWIAKLQNLDHKQTKQDTLLMPFLLVAQILAPCSDNTAKLVTVEQSCRVITGPLFKECNSQVRKTDSSKVFH